MPDHTQLDRIEGRLARIELDIHNLIALTRATLSETITMASKFDGLNDKITELETVQESAVALLGTLAQEIRDAAGDPAAIQALADRIDADKTKLAAAVEANTGTGSTP